MNALRAVPSPGDADGPGPEAIDGVLEVLHAELSYDPATDAEALLLCALLWSYKGKHTSPEIARITTTVTAADFHATAYGTLFGVLAQLVEDGVPHDVAGVSNALIRSGGGSDKDGNLRRRLLSAATINADESSATYYADMVLSQAYRRSFRTVGASISEAAEQLPEEDLLAHMVEHGRRQRAAFNRLNTFRSAHAEHA